MTEKSKSTSPRAQQLDAKRAVPEEQAAPPKTSDTNTDSNRVLVTKRAIYQALADLMAERDFHSISVRDIQERAGVSRSTFYRCFEDKYDVINWSFKRFKQIMVQDRDQFYSFETSMRVQLRYLSDNRDYFAQALKYRGQNSLHDYIYETNAEYMTECWHAAHGDEEPLDYPTLAMIQFAASGTSAIIEQWIIANCKQDINEVAQAVENLMPKPLAETLY